MRCSLHLLRKIYLSLFFHKLSIESVTNEGLICSYCALLVVFLSNVGNYN